MPAERIAQSLAFINWNVLSGLAVGSLAATVLGRLATSATRGYLAFTALCAAAFGLLAYLSDGGLPAASAALGIHPDAAWDGPRRMLLAALTLAALVYAVAVARRARARLLGVVAVGIGIAALVAGALGWGGGFPAAIPLALQLILLAGATGGAFAAMVLGHWYLVTPKLPEAPLILICRVLVGILAIQLGLFWTWQATGAGVGAAPLQTLVGQWAVFVWLRLVVGLGFPLVVSWAALQTARSRSMESATGLLYISVGSIAAGTILASGLYFGAGLLV